LPGGCIKFPDEPDTHQRRDPAHFVIRTKVHWFGNAYFRGPDGSIGGTRKGCAWESCYIMVDGKQILVAGLPGDTVVEQQAYGGKTMLLVGRLVHHKRNDGVPPDVLLVDRLWIVP
jgi:hypothetical protein